MFPFFMPPNRLIFDHADLPLPHFDKSKCTLCLLALMSVDLDAAMSLSMDLD